MSTLVNKIVFHIMARDPADESQQIINTYNASTEEQRAVVDEIFVNLTGYRLCTIIEGREREVEKARAPARSSEEG
jgi:hypothetical protein